MICLTHMTLPHSHLATKLALLGAKAVHKVREHAREGCHANTSADQHHHLVVLSASLWTSVHNAHAHARSICNDADKIISTPLLGCGFSNDVIKLLAQPRQAREANAAAEACMRTSQRWAGAAYGPSSRTRGARGIGIQSCPCVFARRLE